MTDTTATSADANATTPSAPPDLESAIQHMHDQVASVIDQLSRIDLRGLASARDELNAVLQAHKDAQATGGTQAGAQPGGGQPVGQPTGQAGAPDPRSQAGQPAAGTRTTGPGPAAGTGAVSPANRAAGESSPPS